MPCVVHGMSTPSRIDSASSREHEVDIHRHARAEAGAGGAGAERRVEREGARLDLGELQRVPVRAGQLLGEVLPRGIPLLVDEVDLHHSPGEPEGRLDRVGDAAEDVVARHEAVDDHGDVVLVALLQHRRLGELDELAVDDRAGVALGAELAEEVDELALLLADDRRDDLVARALGQLHELVGDLLHGLALDDLAAHGAVRHADARPEQAHVVVDLGDRADGRARVAVGGLLVDRDRGAEPLDEVDVGSVDLPEELAGVRAQRLDVAALALGEDRVEGEAGLSGAAEAREDDERITRDVEVDVLEIVHAGTADTEFSGAGDRDDRHSSSVGGASDTGVRSQLDSARSGAPDTGRRPRSGLLRVPASLPDEHRHRRRSSTASRGRTPRTSPTAGAGPCTRVGSLTLTRPLSASVSVAVAMASAPS